MKPINLFEVPFGVLTEDEIIYTLKNKETLLKSINEKLYFVKNELCNDNNEMIETASFRSLGITDISCAGGRNKDLMDVLTRYYANRREKEEEYLKFSKILIKRKYRIERIWQCFLILEEPYYTYIKRLYVEGEKYITVEAESGFSRQVFAKYRKEALNLMIHFYDLPQSMQELSCQFQRNKNNKVSKNKKKQKGCQKIHNGMEQISMYDFLTEINNPKG